MVYGRHVSEYQDDTQRVDRELIIRESETKQLSRVLREMQSILGCRQQLVPEPPRVIPADELLPPDGFQMPGFSDGHLPSGIMKAFNKLQHGTETPQPVLLREGRPLTELTDELVTENSDKRKAAMETAAKVIRAFMSNPGKRKYENFSTEEEAEEKWI